MTTGPNTLGAAMEEAMKHGRERGVLLEQPETPSPPQRESMTIAVSRNAGLAD